MNVELNQSLLSLVSLKSQFLRSTRIDQDNYAVTSHQRERILNWKADVLS